MEKKKMSGRIVAAALGAAMLLSYAACRKTEKKSARKTEVLETDPYFDVEMTELALPIDESKALQFKNISEARVCGDTVLLQYSLSYELPEGAQDDKGAFAKDFPVDEYFRSGTAVFDRSGNLIQDIVVRNDSDENIWAAATTEKGTLYYLTGQYLAPLNEYLCAIKEVDTNGQELNSFSLDLPHELKTSIIEQMGLAPDGKIILQRSSINSKELFVLDAQGKYLYTLSAMDRFFASGIFNSDGKNYIISLPVSMESMDLMVHEVDLETGEVKKGKKAKGLTNVDSLIAGEDGVYTQTANGIAKYDLANAKLEELLDWNQMDVNQSLLNEVKCYPKTRDEMYALALHYGSNYSECTPYMMHLVRAQNNPHAGQKILYVGGIGIPQTFYEFAYRYNCESGHPARIQTVDYVTSAEGTLMDENYLVDLTSRVYLDMLSGEGPDLLVNFSEYAQFDKTDVLCDLNPYIDGPNGIDRTEYFDNIFRAMETGGRLFHAPFGFGLRGYMANSDMLKANRNWTFDEMDQCMNLIPEGVSLMPKTSYRDLIDNFVGTDLEKFADFGTKDVQFNCDEMKRVLDAVKKYGSPQGDSAVDITARVSAMNSRYGDVIGLLPDMSPDGVSMQLYDGRTAMIPTTISDLMEYNFYNGLAAGKGLLLGYPSVDGKGICAFLEVDLAIATASKYKEEAWDIIKNFYGEDAQMRIGSDVTHGRAMPLKVSAFEAQMEAGMERIHLAYEESLKNAPKTANELQFVYFDASDAMPKALEDAVRSVTCAISKDEALINIVKDEADGYFTGSRTVEDVLANIDKRAAQVVKEK